MDHLWLGYFPYSPRITRVTLSDTNEFFRQIYPNELESQLDFNGFTDLLHTFDLQRGKRTGADEDDESRVVGQFKVRQQQSCRIIQGRAGAEFLDKSRLGGSRVVGQFKVG